MTHSPEPSGFLPERGPSHQAVWRWRLLDADATETTTPLAQPRFTSQSDAETWVGEVWRDLAEHGVESVTLCEGDREVYGPMSLRA